MILDIIIMTLGMLVGITSVVYVIKLRLSLSKSKHTTIYSYDELLILEADIFIPEEKEETTKRFSVIQEDKKYSRQLNVEFVLECEEVY